MNAEEIFEQYPSPYDSDQKENESPLQKRYKPRISKDENYERRKLPERSSRVQAIKRITSNYSASYDSTATKERLSEINIESAAEPASSRKNVESQDEIELMSDGRIKITFDNLDPIRCDNGVDSSTDDEDEEFPASNVFTICDRVIHDAPIVADSLTDEYEVERILLIRKFKKETRYLLKWKGYPLYQMSWAKENDLTGCPKVKKNFEDRLEVCKKIYNSLQNKEDYKGFKDNYVTSIITESFVEQNMLEDGLVKIMLTNNFAPLVIENWTRFREAWPDSFTWTVESYFSFPTSVEVDKLEHSECCNCNVCDPDKCPCVAKTVTSFGHVRANMDNYIKECHKNCGCSTKCPSKVFRRGRTIPLMLFRTPKCGWSVRTMVAIPARRFVIEYTGLIKTFDECHNIDDQTYLFNCDLPDGTIKYVVDATHHGNESRFVNHNCEPNLKAYSVFGYHNDPALTRIVFFSIRAIEAGEELTFNYFPHELDLKLVDPKEKRICRCGAKTCRGFLL